MTDASSKMDVRRLKGGDLLIKIDVVELPHSCKIE